MAAPKGNQFWKLRTSVPQQQIFDSNEDFEKACIEYFEATDKRKWNRIEVHGKESKKVQVPNETPYTWTGLYLFLGISHTTWQDWEKDTKNKDRVAICTRVRQIIYTQKFEGAAVGAFNALIISRDLEQRQLADLESGGKPIASFNPQVAMAVFLGKDLKELNEGNPEEGK